MMSGRQCLSVLLLAAACVAAQGQGQGTGAFPAVMVADERLPTHTLYHPQDLAALGERRLPIVVWGNGACLNVGNRFRGFLTEIASHGFLVLALGPIGPAEAEVAGSPYRGPPAPGSPAARQRAEGAGPPLLDGQPLIAADTTARQMIDAIDWALAEHARPGSRWHGRLDPQRVAVMGQSCGGLQAIDAARDPRVTTLGVWNSGLFPDDRRTALLAGATVTKADLPALRLPALYISGDRSDQAFPNADDDSARLAGPVFRAWLEGTGHRGTYAQPNGGDYAPVAVAWLRWQLQGDDVAARWFKGSACSLCIHPRWHVSRRRMD